MNERVYYVAVVVLGLCAGLSVAGLVLCSILSLPEPQSLYGIAGTCLGTIGGLLSIPRQSPPSGGTKVLP